MGWLADLVDEADRTTAELRTELDGMRVEGVEELRRVQDLELFQIEVLSMLEVFEAPTVENCKPLSPTQRLAKLASGLERSQKLADELQDALVVLDVAGIDTHNGEPYLHPACSVSRCSPMRRTSKPPGSARCRAGSRSSLGRRRSSTGS